MTIVFSTGDLFVMVGGLIGGVTLCFQIAYFIGRLRGDQDTLKRRVDAHDEEFDTVHDRIREAVTNARN